MKKALDQSQKKTLTGMGKERRREIETDERDEGLLRATNIEILRARDGETGRETERDGRR